MRISAAWTRPGATSTALRAGVPDITVARIRAGQPDKDPARKAALLDGLRLAGMPEGTA